MKNKELVIKDLKENITSIQEALSRAKDSLSNGKLLETSFVLSELFTETSCEFENLYFKVLESLDECQ